MPSLRFFSTDSTTDVSTAWIVVVCLLLLVAFLWHRYIHEVEHVWIHVKTPMHRAHPVAEATGKATGKSTAIQSPHLKHITIDIRYGVQEPPPLDLSAAKVDDTETKKTV